MIKEIVALSSRVSRSFLISILVGATPLWAAGETSSTSSPQDPRAELAALRAEIEKLLARVAELETRQSSAATAAANAAPTAPAAAATPAVAASAKGSVPATAAVSWRWSGDARYRSETLNIEGAPTRQRDRVRARVGFVADVSEDVTAGVRIGTSDGLDPRSANVTLDQLGERKTIGIDLAYLRWQPGGRHAAWQFTAGKMPTPWRVTPGFFFDTDINPEGLAVGWKVGDQGPFASLYYLSLLERRTTRDSWILGAQVGWRGEAMTLAASYVDYQSVQGFDPFLDRNPAAAFGNSLATGSACMAGLTQCLAQDFDILQGLIDYRGTLASRPLRLYAEYAVNLAFERSRLAPVAGNAARGGGDDAFSVGVSWGDTRAAGGLEVSAVYQDIERDALYAPWLDADFASGFSASSGLVWRLGYALTPRWVLNASWFDTERVLESGADRREQRLHLDVNTRF